MARRRRRETSKKQAHARRRGLQASAGFGALALVTNIVTAAVFDLRDEQVVLLVVLLSALAGLAAWFVYLGVSRSILPSWRVDRLAYSNEAAWIDNEPVTVSKPSHIESRTWSRGYARFVLIAWVTVWALATASAIALAWIHAGFRS